MWTFLLQRMNTFKRARRNLRHPTPSLAMSYTSTLNSTFSLAGAMSAFGNIQHEYMCWFFNLPPRQARLRPHVRNRASDGMVPVLHRVEVAVEVQR